MRILLFIILTLCLLFAGCNQERVQSNQEIDSYRLLQVDFNGQVTYYHLVSPMKSSSSLRVSNGEYSTISKFTMVSSLEIKNKDIVEVIDTLIVNGDLDLKNLGDLLVNKGALVVVIGNLTNYNKTDLIVKGHLVVVGILETKTKTNIINTGIIDLCHKVQGKSDITGIPANFDVNLKFRNMLVTCQGLPISLKSFEVRTYSDYDIVEFCTGKEHNSAYVEIQSSTDEGVVWKKVVQLESKYPQGGCYSYKNKR